MIDVVGNPQKNDDKLKVKAAVPSPDINQANGSSAVQAPTEAIHASEELEIIELEDLEDIEFLIDEIEDQIAPLAL